MRVFSNNFQLSFMILLMGCAVVRADADKVELISPKEAWDKAGLKTENLEP